MYTRYILRTVGAYGYWVSGNSKQELLDVLKKKKISLTDRQTVIVDKFTSDFVFAPYDRPAENGEADAFMTTDGYTTWQDCNREEVFEGSFAEFRKSKIS